MIAQHPNGLQLTVGADGQPYYRRPGMLGWAPMPRASRVGLVGLGGFNFFHDVCCDKGSAVGTVVNVATMPAQLINKALSKALGGTFIGSAVRAAGKAVQTGLDAVSKAAKDLGTDISKIPVIGGALSAVYDVATDPVTLPITIADDIVHGDSIGQVLSDSINHEVATIKAAAPYVEAVCSLVPGIGGMCASCIAVGVGVAEGRPVDQIVVEAAAAQIPGGPIVVAGYVAAKTVLAGRARPLAWDTLVTGAISGIASAGGVTIPPVAASALKSAAKFSSDIVNGKNPKEAGLDSLVAAIPTSTDAGKSAHAAITAAMAETKATLQGSKVGDALFSYAIKQCPAAHQQDIQKSVTTAIGFAQGSNLQAAKSQSVPALLAKLQAVGAADATPIVGAARKALGGKGTRGFDVGHGLMQYRGDLYQTTALRAALGDADDSRGFDVALALKIGNVASTLPKGVSGPVAAGMLIAKGAQTAASSQKATIHAAVSSDRDVAAGIRIVHTAVTPLEWGSLGVLAAGTVLLVAGVVTRG